MAPSRCSRSGSKPQVASQVGGFSYVPKGMALRAHLLFEPLAERARAEVALLERLERKLTRASLPAQRMNRLSTAKSSCACPAWRAFWKSRSKASGISR